MKLKCLPHKPQKCLKAMVVFLPRCHQLLQPLYVWCNLASSLPSQMCGVALSVDTVLINWFTVGLFSQDSMQEAHVKSLEWWQKEFESYICTFTLTYRVMGTRDVHQAIRAPLSATQESPASHCHWGNCSSEVMGSWWRLTVTSI